MIALLLLGRPTLLHDGAPLAIPRRKSRALLFYLAARRAPTTRDHALDLLWPDLPRPAGQQTLRATLYGLRKVIGDRLLADDTSLWLDPGLDVDTWQLDDALGGHAPAAQLDAALARYRGDFLDGFSVPDAPDFDDWAATVRERYRQAVTYGLAALARAHEARGAFADAVGALDRALALDPLQEDVQRHAMRLQYLAGDRVGAIRRYEQLARRLDDELGVPPMAETRAVYDAVITDSRAGLGDGLAGGAYPAQRPAEWPGVALDGAAVATAGRAHAVRAESAGPTLLPFTGRAVELQALGMAAAAGQLALVEGEPGIGKTRLVTEFLAGMGAQPLVGTARELDQALPYQPLVEALRGLAERPGWAELRGRLVLPQVWAAEVSRLLPELTSADAPPAPAAVADGSRLREGLSQLMRALARLQPVALFIDDLQWADAATLGLLGYLVRQRLGGVTLIAAARQVEPRSQLAALAQALTREGRLARIRPRRLAPEDTLTLARHLSPSAPAPLAVWLARNGEGNPYVISELVRHARTEGLLGPDGALEPNALDADSPVVPPSIYTLIESRLAGLSEPARRVLDAGVAAGREFSSSVVAHAAALSDEAALDALDEIAAAGLARPLDDDHYEFDHSLTMEVAYREVGEARHRLTHRRVAEALEAVHRRRLDDVAGAIAMHYVEAGEPQRAAGYALRAGQRAAALAAWDEAITFYRQALTAGDQSQRLAVLTALATAQFAAGAHAQAADVYREVAELAQAQHDPGAAAYARLAQAQSLLSQGRFAEVIGLIREMTAAPDARLAMRAELLWGTALSLEGADLPSAADHLRRAERLAGGPDDVGNLAHARFELGSVLAQQGELEAAVAQYRDALAVAAAGGEASVSWHILAHNNVAYHLHLLGDPSAVVYARTGLSLAQERGAIGLQPYLLSTLGEIALGQGDLGTAERHFTEALALAERLEISERVAGLGANLGLVAARRGQTALAIHRLSTAQARADALGTRHLAAQIRIWLAPLLPAPEARAVLAEARALAESGGRRRLLAEIAVLEGHVENG